jgi:hypothetical protein
MTDPSELPEEDILAGEMESMFDGYDPDSDSQEYDFDNED